MRFSLFSPIQHLLLELKNYEATSKETREEQQSGVVDAEMGIIPVRGRGREEGMGRGSGRGREGGRAS